MQGCATTSGDVDAYVSRVADVCDPVPMPSRHVKPGSDIWTVANAIANGYLKGSRGRFLPGTWTIIDPYTDRVIAKGSYAETVESHSDLDDVLLVFDPRP